MINVSSLAHQVFVAINSNSALVNSGYTRFEFGADLNTKPEVTPWVTVWPGDLALDPKNVAAGTFLTWLGTQEVLVYHQVSNRRGSAVAELKEAQGLILTTVGSFVTMNGRALHLSEITAGIFNTDPTNESQFLTNLIRLVYKVEGGLT